VNFRLRVIYHKCTTMSREQNGAMHEVQMRY
jgi:hypothetical protein